ncbi:uncharacterized protein K444DRAFT_721226 [Hyaloscypha bicolor E]|uniref:Integrase core domain-containing protein n=1 Tax=Hyaloscypha bicolor E TaxID=1095630 RepID=A0A2J6TCS3_9HELO|nr:uncharacterized protein K444DRAFT_721226 [Hyaloscypha bicolor E]PMD60768.1 hypothetical protein K444DRAFT_721226 [Hyaloscypha bicolor E]
MKAAREEYNIHGPNFVWSIDSYCKLRFCGIEIYAGIDAYSRFVPWIYIGISNGYAISMQYLDLVDEMEVIPLHIRSDRGCETPIITNAHYILYKATCQTRGINPYQFSDLY